MHMSDAQFQGRVAVVTGASQGIGQAITSSLTSEGVDVVMCSRSADALSQAVGHVANASRSDGRQGRVEAYTADVRDPSQMDSLMAKAVDTFGRLDILINNAGVGRFQTLAELSIEDWRTVLETNLSGVFFACHAAIPLLRRGGGGWIINVSSLAGSHPFPGGAAYCASKAGLNALSEVLMQELRDDDIRVSCVAPRFGQHTIWWGDRWLIGRLETWSGRCRTGGPRPAESPPSKLAEPDRDTTVPPSEIEPIPGRTTSSSRPSLSRSPLWRGDLRYAAAVDERSVRAFEVLDGELGLGGLQATVHSRKQAGINDEVCSRAATECFAGCRV